MQEQSILELVHKYNSVSIIGMDKNVGKTMVLNHLINNISVAKLPLGLTSIGLDGEETDIITNTKKPRIYVKAGTLIATAKQCLYSGDITREILETTGIYTPMGEIIIARALSDGFVELGGPSQTNYIAHICERLRELGSKFTIVDGALSRKTLASPDITEAAILATGASLSKNMSDVIQKTKHTVELLLTEGEEDEKVINICSILPVSSRITIIYKDYSIKTLNSITALDASKEIADNTDDTVKHVFIKGIFSDNLLEGIIKLTNKYKDITFLVQDGTKLFLSKDLLAKFKKLGGTIKVINQLNIICITCNPISPYGYEFNKDLFTEKLKSEINLPIYNVKSNV